MDIYYIINYQNIKINKYGPYKSIDDEEIKRIIIEPKRTINNFDWTVLSIYLSILKIDNPIKDKLNKIGITYERVINHLRITNINNTMDIQIQQDKIKDFIFTNLINNIINSNEDGYTRVTPAEPNYLYYIHDCLFEPQIVNSSILEDLLVEMNLYDTFIIQFDHDYNEIDTEANKILDQILEEYPGLKSIYNTSKDGLNNEQLFELRNNIFSLANNTPKLPNENKCKVLNFNEEKTKRRSSL
jgi:hypothetical protein